METVQVVEVRTINCYQCCQRPPDFLVAAVRLAPSGVTQRWEAWCDGCLDKHNVAEDAARALREKREAR